MHGGDHVAAALKACGVRFLFTLCGGHISPILAGCKQCGIRVIDVRHEATAVFAADAVARLTGIPGVAAVTAGPGATNTITAIKNAQLAQSPVVLLVGATATVLERRGSLQDIDQRALLAPHVKRMIRVRRVRDLAPAVLRAMNQAAAGVPGPVAVECPVDLLYDEQTVRKWYAAGAPSGKRIAARAQRWYLGGHLSRVFAGTPPSVVPADELPQPEPPDGGAVRRAARRLERAERPVLVVGSQALIDAPRADEIAGAVRRLGIPVYLSGMARGLLGPDHVLQLRHRRSEALREADCVVLAGVPCDFRMNYGAHIRRGATLISANRSRRDLRLNRKPDLPVQGDAGRFLIGLADSVAPGDRWTTWLEQLRTRDSERESQIARRAVEPTDLVNPLHLCREIDAAMGERDAAVGDGGDFVATASYIVRPRGPLTWLDPGVFGTLGVGAGFALGAKLCRPESQVWLLWGDGAAGYGLIELDTFVRHDVPVIAVVGNDACWMQIAREQVGVLNDDVGCALLPSDYHTVAEGLGGRGFRVDRDDAVPGVLRAAAQAAHGGRPVVVNALIGRTDFRRGSISM